MKKIQIAESYLDELISQTMTRKKNIQEIFVQTSEIESMEPGLARDKAILRLSMIAELDAVNLYQRFADLATSEDVSKVMLDVANEEIAHAGEFEALLEHLDPDYEKYEEEGEEEVEDLTGISEE